jgi:hypothetical protein
MFNYADAESQIVVKPDQELPPSAEEKAAKLASDPDAPSTADLTSWQIRDDQLSYHAATSMKLPVADVSGEFSRRVILRDIARYTERTANSTVTTWGVAVRLTVTVWAVKLEGQLTLPMVAAQAQLGLINASADLQVLGFNNNEVGKHLPKFQHLDVSNYGEYTNASDQIRVLISKHETDIVPVVLKTFTPPPDRVLRMTEAVGTARALRHIARRKTLREALDDTSSWPELAEVLGRSTPS